MGFAGPAAAATSWQRYVLDPASATPQPVRVAQVIGDVQNAGALVAGGSGEAVFKSPAGKPKATVVLDFGQDVGGTPEVSVDSVTPDQNAGTQAAPELLEGWSEDRDFVLSASGNPVTDHGSLATAFTGGPAATYPAVPGTIGSPEIEGGMRYYSIQLSSGTASLSHAQIQFGAYRATPDLYQGHFLSSDDSLNRMWYSGAYTVHLDMAPIGTVGNALIGTPDTSPNQAIYDGAKRDRAEWSGDLVIEDPTDWLSIGTNGQDYERQSLLRFLSTQLPTGEFPGAEDFIGPLVPFPYSSDYSSYAAIAMIDYYRYTGDAAFITAALPKLEQAAAYIAGLVDSNGLVVGNDKDYDQATRTDETTEYSLVYIQFLRALAWAESQQGNTANATTYNQQAAAVAHAVNAHLWNAKLGAYEESNTSPNVIPEDANANAIRLGIAPADHIPSILNVLQGGWTPYGAVMTQPDVVKDPSGNDIEPLPNGWEMEARFLAGDDAGALKIMHLYYDPMMDPTTAAYTATFWENMSTKGIANIGAGESLAHGWASAVTRLLTEDVLGIAPVDPGYSHFTITPHPTDLKWTEGRVPTPNGPIDARWRSSKRRFTMTVDVPSGTTADATIPTPHPGGTYMVDGEQVDGPHVSGIQPGLHVLQWSARTDPPRPRIRTVGDQG